MKIDRLELRAFGPFTGASVDFGEDPVGLHLLYGPNEAGKSSTLRAISGWLFGIPTRSPDNFIHTYKDLRIGGRLQNSEGESLSFVRRKATKNDLLSPLDNAALPPDSLTPFLGGMDRAAFERIWAIDRDELIEGGKDLRALKGLAGESLFATALGISGLGRALARLEGDAQQVFVGDGRTKTLIRVASRNHADALKRKHAAETSVNKWTKLKKQLKDARQKQEEAGSRLKELRSRSGRLTRVLAALEDFGERQSIEADLRDRAEDLVLPPEYSIETRRATQARLAEVSGRLGDAKVQLDGPEGWVARCAALEVDDDLLAQEGAIEQLQKKAGAYEKACADLPKREAERQMLKVEAERLLADLDPALDWEDAEKLRLRASVESEVARLGVQHGSLRESLDSHDTQIRELEIEVKALQEQLDGLPAPLDTTRLERTLREITSQGDLEQLASEHEADGKRSMDQASREIQRLGVWSGKAEEVESLKLPLRTTVDQFSTRFSTLQDELERLERDSQKLSEDSARLAKEIQEDEAQGDVPTREQLDDARSMRDRGWKLVRDSWLEGNCDKSALEKFAGGTPLEDAYESAVSATDRLADGLIDESELAARLEQKRIRYGALQEERTALEARQSDLRAEEEAARNEWKALWAEAEIQEPLTPREMAEWLEGFGGVRSLVEKARQAEEERVEYQSRIEASRDRLAECLTSLKRPLGDAEARLSETLASSQDLVDAGFKIEGKREQFEMGIRDLRAKLDSRKAARATAEQDLVEWKTKWGVAMASLGCEPEASVDQATDRVRQIRDTFAKRDAIAESDSRRIRPLEEDKARFEEDVRDLVGRCAPDLADAPPRLAAETLVQRLKEAQVAFHKRESLQERIDEVRESLPGYERQQREARDLLAQLCRHAGVESPDELDAVEDASRRKDALRQRLDEIDRRLLKIGEGRSIPELIAETKEKSGDDLRAELTELEEQVEVCEKERDHWTSEVATLAQECDEVEGSADSAGADQEALGYVSEVSQHAEQYLRLRLATHLLRRRIDKHRAENQDPMVRLASEIFSQITCGSFSGLALDYDDAEEPTLVGVRGQDGVQLGVEAFSKGTADQLYLALRLAYLQSRLVGEEPMPIILDDILVDFDDRRAAATLEILADLSRRTQVILLTHHEHVRDLAQRTLDQGVLNLCELRSDPSALAGQSDG